MYQAVIEGESPDAQRVRLARERKKAKKDLLAEKLRDKRVQDKEKLKLTPKPKSKPILKQKGQQLLVKLLQTKLNNISN